jgi:DNA repair protein RecO (recombination protein O)
MNTGGVVCDECKPPGAATLDEDTVNLLGALLAGEWDYCELASERARASASGIVAAYTQWHIERGLRSLNHVERA